MSGRLSREETQKQIERIGNGITWEMEDRRTKIVQKASRVIDAILGKAPGVRRVEPFHDWAAAPKEIPTLDYPGVLPGATQEEDMRVGITGSVGDYYTSMFSNERPGDSFNSGFYAGVLAVKKGLVDVDQFFADTERPVVEDPSS